MNYFLRVFTSLADLALVLSSPPTVSSTPCQVTRQKPFQLRLFENETLAQRFLKLKELS